MRACMELLSWCKFHVSCKPRHRHLHAFLRSKRSKTHFLLHFIHFMHFKKSRQGQMWRTTVETFCWVRGKKSAQLSEAHACWTLFVWNHRYTVLKTESARLLSFDFWPSRSEEMAFPSSGTRVGFLENKAHLALFGSYDTSDERMLEIRWVTGVLVTFFLASSRRNKTSLSQTWKTLA